MKNILTLFASVIALCLIFFSCSQTPKVVREYAIVSGEITMPQGDSVWVRIAKKLDADEKICAAALNEKNQFSCRVPLNAPSEASFYDGNESTQLFLKPGDSIFLIIDTRKFDESIVYSGSGAVENNFIAGKYLEFEDVYWGNYPPRLDTLEGDKAIAVIDSFQVAQQQYFIDYLKSNQVSPEFKKWLKAEITFDHPSRMFSYIMGKYSKNNYQLDTINISPQVYDNFLSYRYNPDSCQLSSKYNDYFYNAMIIINLKTQHETRHLKNYDSVFFAKAKLNFSGYGKEIVVAEKFYDQITDFNTEYLDKYRGEFDDVVKNQDLRDLILNEHALKTKMLAAKMPQNSSIVDLDDPGFENFTYNTIIDKYKGKVIYLDFWASWCGPCKSEMPSSLKMQHEFKNSDVAFVYFSVDKDSTKWSNMIKILQITGDHYRLNKMVNNETNALFDVKFIPRYILINKEGKVVSDEAKRPSDPEAITDINQLL